LDLRVTFDEDVEMGFAHIHSDDGSFVHDSSLFCEQAGLTVPSTFRVGKQEAVTDLAVNGMHPGCDDLVTVSFSKRRRRRGKRPFGGERKRLALVGALTSGTTTGASYKGAEKVAH